MKESLFARWMLIATLITALSIPAPVSAGDCSSPTTYAVQRGDTLFKIARLFGTTTAELSRLNSLANPNRIYTGQVLSIRAGGNCQPTSTPTGTQLHVVQRGETLSRIAARYGTTVAAIATANGIANPSRIYAGQTLVIPGASTAPALASAQLPGLQLSPNPPEQGRTVSISLPAEGRSAVAGALGAWPIQFFREGDRFVGLVGIYALADPGAYSLTLTLTDQAGNATTYNQSIAVANGGYARERLDLTPDKTQLLDPQLTLPERERIAAVVAPITPTRYWQGTFQLPAVGRITSVFGTRRSYNGGPYSSFHGGVDFSFSGGLDIRAPAAGVVVLAEPLIVRGNATIIDHGWGVYSGFWHQSEILVHVGDVVQAGQLIGKIGGTGLATGPHLHWEMFVGGVQVDPLQWTRQSFP
jgi:murein DD-endopeptidase MepM/ murein hydrolase activator NlpD